MSSLRLHFVFTSSSLRLHFVFTSSSLRLHFVFTSSSLCLHFIFTWSSLGLHFIFTSSSLGLHLVFALSSLFLRLSFAQVTRNGAWYFFFLFHICHIRPIAVPFWSVFIFFMLKSPLEFYYLPITRFFAFYLAYFWYFSLLFSKKIIPLPPKLHIYAVTIF